MPGSLLGQPHHRAAEGSSSSCFLKELEPDLSNLQFQGLLGWQSSSCQLLEAAGPQPHAALCSAAFLLPGHLLSTAEVESALLGHAAVSEAAVVSHPHPLKGECLYCFVTLKDGHEFSKNLADELKKQGRDSQISGWGRAALGRQRGG